MSVMETKTGKLVGVEIRVCVNVPNLEAATAVRALFDLATRSVAHQGWGGGKFEAALIYDAPVVDAPLHLHDSRLN